MYPAFVNCTTIDWFSEWPADALLEVADKYLSEISLGSEEEVKLIVSPKMRSCQDVKILSAYYPFFSTAIEERLVFLTSIYTNINDNLFSLPITLAYQKLFS